jgi:hypothetical protein
MDIGLDETDAINCAFTLPGSDGSFTGQLGGVLHRLSLTRPSLILCFAPKAAGTFLRTAAIEAVDGQLVRIVHAQGGRDAQPYLPTFIAYYLGRLTERVLVGHAHMQALPANRNFIGALNLRPVIMLRSLPDMLASYWDMLENDPAARTEGLNCAIPEGFLAMSREDKADFLTDILAPWYASYFASWLDFAADAPERVCVLTYRDFLANPAAELHRALQHARLEQPMIVCQAACNKVWKDRLEYRFNHGVEGRGRRYFPASRIARMARLLSHYDIPRDAWDALMGA